MESGWQIAFIVLQVIFVAITGYFVIMVRGLEKKMNLQDDRIDGESKRIDAVVTKQAVEFERVMTTRDMILSVEKKIDTLGAKIDRILEPSFFQRCPNIGKGKQ